MSELVKAWIIKRKLMIVISTLAVFLLVILVLVFSLFSKSDLSDQTDESLANFYMSQTSSLESSILSDEGEINSSRDNETETEKYIFVDVKGAVRMPGVYEINSETRLTDVITLAGGFLPTADQSVVNLSQKLTDQMMITIPTLEIKNESTDLNEGEEKVPVVISIPNETSDSQPGKVNINMADISELQTLSGIGEKKAERILQYRQEHGSFKSVEELKEVSGIGDKTFEALADFISVGKN